MARDAVLLKRPRRLTKGSALEGRAVRCRGSFFRCGPPARVGTSRGLLVYRRAGGTQHGKYTAYDAVLQQPDAALLLGDGIAEGMMQVVAQHVPPAAQA
eukprot:scaffold6893_cov104-Phaeocystis_antarctica.AAC.3